MDAPVRAWWRGPAPALVLLAPAVGELLSGSAPPVEYFFLPGFVGLTLLYGGGALLIRELAHRWRAGWAGILLLGAAYGTVEEGLVVKSFFDPGWMDLGVLGVYGREWGVNWVWTFALTVYHAVVSIAIPILVVTLLFPAWQNRPWLTRRGFRVWAWLFGGICVLFALFFLANYKPPLLPWLAAAWAVWWLAKRAAMGVRLPAPTAGRLLSPARFWLLGFMGAAVLILGMYLLPQAGIHFVWALVLHAGALAWVANALAEASGWGGRWQDPHRFAAAAGALSFFALLALRAESEAQRADNPAGMAVVGVATFAFLLWAGARVRRAAALAQLPEPE